MPRSFADAPKQSATDAAAALMSEDAAPDTAAPETWPNLEESPQVEPQPQPERQPRRRADGRFAPRDETVPTQPEGEPHPGADSTTAEPESTQDQIDYRAELERQRAENERLRRTYEANTRQQREALEAARREAEQLRLAQEAEKKAERQRLLDDARREVAAIPENTQERWLAERQLAQVEMREAQRLRDEVEEERQRQQQAQQIQAARQADAMIREASWDSLVNWATRRGVELGLSADEAEGALKTLQTEDVARLFRELSAQSIIEHTRTVLGNRLDAELVRRAQAREQGKAREAEGNRQAVLAEGTHRHVRIPAQTAPQPAYVAYTRENKGVRLGRKAAVEAVMAGILDTE